MKDKITYGEKYGPAMKVTTREAAKAYLEVCVEHTMRVLDVSNKEALSIELQNIGYYAGYYDKDTFKRVMELYATEHPVFGNDPVIYDSLETAYETGLRDGSN